MNYSFEYIDLILLAMIAGFIFLRLRGILGRRTGFEGKPGAQLEKILKEVKLDNNSKKEKAFDDIAQKEFLNGAKIDYETMETSVPGVFFVVYIVRGASLVVWAIKDGRDVSDQIINYLNKIVFYPFKNFTYFDF